MEVIGPKVTIEVSATPHLKENMAEIEKVHLNRVKDEEMIKSEIIVNPEFLKIVTGSKSSDELVIEQALRKRQELSEMYKAENTNINPLVLIQLPDNKGKLLNKKEDVVKILKKKKIEEENGKLAIWLSEDKSETLPNIEKSDNDVEVLIFKQAIALGWDCPRASILVIFRESKSFIFTIQTIGRIMRMPELKYYKEQELNKGFIFTNLASIEITEEYAKDYISVYESKRNNQIYKDISLPSVYLKRQRERTRLSGKFIEKFLKIAEEVKLEKRIIVKALLATGNIVADGKIKDIDKSGEIEHKGILSLKLNEKELQEKFDNFIIQACSPYAPVDSSDRIKNAIYQFFKQKFKLDKYSPEIQKIVLEKRNLREFTDTINLAKDRYKIDIVNELSEKREIEKTEKWEIPILIGYNSKYRKEEKQKSIVKPYYFTDQSDPEKMFIEILDNSGKVIWWFKNGSSEIKYFAVMRTDGWTFYPDFIVQFKDGSIGIFDTKKGTTAKEARERAEGLQEYIKEQNKKGKKLWGGIVIEHYKSWRLNDQEKYEYDLNNLSKWKILKI